MTRRTQRRNNTVLVAGGRDRRSLVWLGAILLPVVAICSRASDDAMLSAQASQCKVKSMDLPNGVATCEDGSSMLMKNIQLQTSVASVVELEYEDNISVDEMVYEGRKFNVEPMTGHIYSNQGKFIGHWISGIPYGKHPGMEDPSHRLTARRNPMYHHLPL